MLAALKDAWFPRVCLACRRTVPDAGSFCATCSFLLDRFPESLDRLAPSPIDSLKAAYVYGGPIRDALLAFKHSGHAEHADRLARLLVNALGPPCPIPDLVIPVPLYWTRLFRRGYNQAALLAGTAARLLGTRFSATALVRTRNTGSQFGLSAGRRLENVSGAFRVSDRKAIAGARLLLVDDVVATGATVGECGAVLKEAGAVSVDVWAVARSVG